VGVVILEAGTGRILAWVGGWDPSDIMVNQVDTVTRKRAPGSTLKPFAFALAMQRGWLTPDTVLEDRPRSYRDYHPSNMAGNWSGDVSAGDALVRSLNYPALQVVERTGVQEFLSFLRSCGPAFAGVKEREVGLGAVLGGGMDISLLELTAAYTVFANRGIPRSPMAVEGHESPSAPVMAPGVAYWISRMLSGQERDDRLYGHVADVERPVVAFKTGTSHGHRDAWAIGWTGEIVIGVWIGRLDGKGVSGLSGSTHAAPILGRIAMELVSPNAWPEPSSDVVQQQGQEVIRGVTDPYLHTMVSKTHPPRILSPRPDFTWKGLEVGDLTLPLKADVPDATTVHWFVNGNWVGKTESSQALPHVFSKGQHTVRAVFPEGRSETRTVTVL